MSTHAVSPALVSPPDPPFRGAPFLKEIHRGGNPSRLRRRFAGGKQHGSRLFIESPPCAENAFRTQPGTAGPEHVFCLGEPPPLRRSTNPPNPPREVGHTGRTTCSLLCARLPALGGKVGLQPARSFHEKAKSRRSFHELRMASSLCLRTFRCRIPIPSAMLPYALCLRR